MEPDDHASLEASLKTLVDLRNELVHHLLERFDLWSDDGCARAIEHLDAAYESIDQQYAQLRGWCESFDKTRSTMGAWLTSEEGRAWFADGIAPDGTVSWPDVGIVRVLREAARTLGSSDWVSLADAVAWIAEHHPRQLPSRYGCKSWPDVLSKSRVFLHQRRPAADGRMESWFRLAAPAPAAVNRPRS